MADEQREGEAASELESAPEPPAQPYQYICPECATEFGSSTPPVRGIVECPQCNAEFFAPDPADGLDEDERARLAMEEKLRSREEELSQVRWKAISAERRAVGRLRVYVMVGVLACLALAGQLAWKAVSYLRGSGWSIWVASFIFGALACLIAVRMLWNKKREIDAELAKPLQTDPATPPDFSSLGDGSQRWAKIDAMSAGKKSTPS